MKTSYLIIAGIVLVFIIGGIWVYLFFFSGGDSAEDVFSNFGISNTPAAEIPDDPDIGSDTLPPAPTQGPLRQLTTRPVAGFTFVINNTRTGRYAERGTGHIYEVDLTSDAENRISDRTIPGVTDATFSADGDSVALSIESGYEREIIAGIISSNERTIVDPITLPAGAFDPYFVSQTILRYGVTTDAGTDGYELDLVSGESLQIFSIPLRAVHIIWGTEIYVYNKPTTQFLGSLYRVGTQLEAVTPAGYGFSGAVTDSHLIGTAINNDALISYSIDRTTATRTGLSIHMTPEKCAAPDTQTGTIWCAAPFDGFSNADLENWYQGAITVADYLWTTDLFSGTSVLISPLPTAAGRTIDVDMIKANRTGMMVLFRNRIDNTLWIYDRELE